MGALFMDSKADNIVLYDWLSKTFIGNFTKTWTIENRHFDATDVAAEILTEVRLAAQKHFNTDDEIEAVIFL